MIRLTSSSLLGLWSKDNGCTSPDTDATQRESPTLAYENMNWISKPEKIIIENEQQIQIRFLENE